jgi:hypothetical protein
MIFENGVKNIQAAAYNGARTVYIKELNVDQAISPLANTCFIYITFE